MNKQTKQLKNAQLNLERALQNNASQNLIDKCQKAVSFAERNCLLKMNTVHVGRKVVRAL